MVSFAAMLTALALTVASCEKENNGTNGDNSGSNTEQPITDTLPTPNPGQDTTQPTPPPQPQDDWVDLGLPSGLLWATCNLGASTPEGIGNYYAWGETQPKETYRWSNYRYCTVDSNGNAETFTKYNASDHLTFLQPEDDAATVALGADVHIPSKEDWQELLDNTTDEWTTVNGVNGRKFTAANGKTLFLPVQYGNEGLYGYYWSRTLNTGVYAYETAWYLFFNSDQINVYRDDPRYAGEMIRPVRVRQH